MQMKITQPVISTEPKISDLGGQFSTKVKNQTFYFFEGDNFLCNFSEGSINKKRLQRSMQAHRGVS